MNCSITCCCKRTSKGNRTRKRAAALSVSIPWEIELNLDLACLKSAVKKKHGWEIEKKLAPSLNSIEERKEFSRYHFITAINAIDKVLKDKDDEMDLIDLMLNINHEESADFEECKFVAWANIIACIQSIHSVSDILSHVIYYSLNLKNARYESEISLNNIFIWLKGSEFKNLLSLLEELVNNSNYNYLSALVNYSKHCSVVGANFNVNLRKQGHEMKELKFTAFNYKRVCYLSHLAPDFLTEEFGRQIRLINEILNQLNQSFIREC